MKIQKVVENGFDVMKDSATTAAVSSGATVIPVGSDVSNFAAGNRVSVTLSTGSTQATTVSSVDSGAQTVTLGAALTADVDAGALIRVRVMNTAGAMGYTAPLPLNAGRDFVGTVCLLGRTADADAGFLGELSADGGANFVLANGATVSNSTGYLQSPKLLGTHIRFMVVGQNDDAFDIFLGSE